MDHRSWRGGPEFRRLHQDIDELIRGMSPGWRWGLTAEYPPVNLTHTAEEIVVDVICPGAQRTGFEVTVLGGTVTIRGERKPEPGVDDDRYHRRERPAGTFTRVVSVGERLDPDRTTATYTNGILKVRLARAPEATPKRIAIQA